MQPCYSYCISQRPLTPMTMVSYWLASWCWVNGHCVTVVWILLGDFSQTHLAPNFGKEGSKAWMAAVWLVKFPGPRGSHFTWPCPYGNHFLPLPPWAFLKKISSRIFLYWYTIVAMGIVSSLNSQLPLKRYCSMPFLCRDIMEKA